MNRRTKLRALLRRRGTGRVGRGIFATLLLSLVATFSPTLVPALLPAASAIEIHTIWGGFLSWQRDADYTNSHPGGADEQFLVTVQVTLDSSETFTSGGSQVTNPRVGDSIDFPIGTFSSKNEAVAPGATTVSLPVQTVDAAEGWFVARATVPVVVRKVDLPVRIVSTMSARRPATMVGNAGGNAHLETTLRPGNAGVPSASPSTTVVPELFCSSNVHAQPCTFQVPASASDGNSLFYRPATTAETGASQPLPLGDDPAHNASLSSTGTFSWDGRHAPGLDGQLCRSACDYLVAVAIEQRTAQNVTRSTIVVQVHLHVTSDPVRSVSVTTPQQSYDDLDHSPISIPVTVTLDGGWHQPETRTAVVHSSLPTPENGPSSFTCPDTTVYAPAYVCTFTFTPVPNAADVFFSVHATATDDFGSATGQASFSVNLGHRSQQISTISFAAPVHAGTPATMIVSEQPFGSPPPPGAVFDSTVAVYDQVTNAELASGPVVNGQAHLSVTFAAQGFRLLKVHYAGNQYFAVGITDFQPVEVLAPVPPEPPTTGIDAGAVVPDFVVRGTKDLTRFKAVVSNGATNRFTISPADLDVTVKVNGHVVSDPVGPTTNATRSLNPGRQATFTYQWEHGSSLHAGDVVTVIVCVHVVTDEAPGNDCSTRTAPGGSIDVATTTTFSSLSSKATTATITSAVSERGSAPVLLRPDDVTVSVYVNGASIGPAVTTKTALGTRALLQPGKTRKYSFGWTITPRLVLGDTLRVVTCVDVPGDGVPSDNCSQAVTIITK